MGLSVCGRMEVYGRQEEEKVHRLYRCKVMG